MNNYAPCTGHPQYPLVKKVCTKPLAGTFQNITLLFGHIVRVCRHFVIHISGTKRWLFTWYDLLYCVCPRQMQIIRSVVDGISDIWQTAMWVSSLGNHAPLKLNIQWKEANSKYLPVVPKFTNLRNCALPTRKVVKIVAKLCSDHLRFQVNTLALVSSSERMLGSFGVL